MRVILLHYSAPPVIGGVENVIRYQATGLVAAGYDVHVVAGRGEAFAPGVTFHHVPQVDSRHPDVLALKAALDQGRYPAACFEALVAQIRRALARLTGPQDVLIAHNVLSLHKNLALTAALHALAAHPGAPRIIAWHHDLAWQAARYADEMHAGYPWDLARTPLPGAVHVAVSAARREAVAALFGLPPEAIHVIPGGVDSLALLGIGDETRQWAEAVGLWGGRPLLLLPARITRRKNIELALRVVAALRGGPLTDAALVITGPPGPHNPENQRYYAELLALRDALGLGGAAHFVAEHLPDGASDRMVRDLYRLADALIFPSFEEGFGLPILEAGIARLPIFCANIPALAELAGDQAHLFPPEGDPAAIAALIARVLATDTAYQLRARVIGEYDWRNIIREKLVPLLEA
ncbi:MAG: hypothetical protein Kow0077_26550 [Anaerolineae bacterium]